MTAEYLRELLLTNDKIDTPVYLYEKQIILDNIGKLRESFGDRFKLYYSIKANPNPCLLSFICEFVDGIEVASIGELYLALKARVAPNRIIFIGPGKCFEELVYAVEKRLKAIVVESSQELVLINQISTEKKIVSSIVLRINPCERNNSGMLKMGGGPSPFGIDEEQVPELLKLIRNMRYVKFIGIQVYLGTQILNVNNIIKNMETVLNLAVKILNSWNLEFIDFGGGFGIPYFEGDKPLDMRLLKKEMKEYFSIEIMKSIPKTCELFLESGRFIIAESGTFVTKILYKKKSYNKTYLIVDGGSNFHSSAAGIGRFARYNFPISVLKMNSNINKEVERVHIVGPLCTPTDIIAYDVELPVLTSGDYVLIHRSGAYALTASAMHFLGHPTPAEMLIDQGKLCTIKQKGGIAEHYNLYNNYNSKN